LKILKNRIFLSILCIIIAGVISFLLLPRFYKDKGATTSVLRVVEDISKGTVIEKKHISEVEVGKFGLPDNIINDTTKIIGKIAKTGIARGDYIFPQKITDFVTDEKMDRIVKENMRLVAVSVSSIAAGLSSHLKSGDFVTAAVFLNRQEDFNHEQSTSARVMLYPELKNIEVYSVENSRTQSTAQVREQQQAENKPSTSDPVPKTVTLIVTEAQAVKLIEAEYTGKLHMILERRGFEDE
jgi:pilus assembly protein CpaB